MSARPVRSYRVANLECDAPMPGVERRRLGGSQAMLAEVRLAAGTIVPRHHHPNEQFAWILDGALRFFIGVEGAPDAYEIVARAGAVVHIPGDAVHGAEVLEDARVLDVFAPPGEATGLDRETS